MELSALPQTSDPPRGRLSELLARVIDPYLRGEPRGPVPEVLGRLIYPFLRGEAPKPRNAYWLLHRHHRMHRLQGLRGGVQAVEPTTLGWL